jgi:ribose transport system substrate-binding protein
MRLDRCAALRLLVGLLFCGGFAGCGGDAPAPPNGGSSPKVDLGSPAKPAGNLKRIIVLTNGNAPFWDAGAAGAENAAKELNCEADGFQVIVERGKFDVAEQLNKLRQYAGATDIAGVALSVVDAENAAIPREMARLQKAGIKVVTIDSDVNRETARESRFAYLGTDNVVAGRELGIAAKTLLPDGGKYVTFVGVKTAANAKERIGGFAEGAGEKFTSAENLGDGGKADVARVNVREALNRNADTAMLVGIWSYNTPAIIDTVKQLNSREKLKIVGFDADPPAIVGMGEGMLDVMVVQNPYQMGYQGVRLLKALVQKDEATIQEMLPDHGSPNGDLYDTGLKVIVPNEGSPLNAELFGKKTEFLKLEAFKEWLTKYKLTGS